jgi:hypothetical protein
VCGLPCSVAETYTADWRVGYARVIFRDIWSLMFFQKNPLRQKEGVTRIRKSKRRRLDGMTERTNPGSNTISVPTAPQEHRTDTQPDATQTDARDPSGTTHTPHAPHATHTRSRACAWAPPPRSNITPRPPPSNPTQTEFLGIHHDSLACGRAEIEPDFFPNANRANRQPRSMLNRHARTLRTADGVD